MTKEECILFAPEGLCHCPYKFRFLPSEDAQPSPRFVQSFRDIFESTFAVIASTTTEIFGARCIILCGESNIIADHVNVWKDNIGTRNIVLKEMVCTVERD